MVGARGSFPSSPMRRSLLLHPDCRCASVESIGAEVRRSAPAWLMVRYFVSGDIRGLRLPLPSGAARANELWRHTCFEMFIRTARDDAYCEFNFAPSLQWAAYHFDGYRSGMRDLEIRPPRIAIRQDRTSLELQAEFAPGAETDNAGEWNLALSAVIEETNGGISYWSLAHPSGKPDFHHAEAFVFVSPACPA